MKNNQGSCLGCISGRYGTRSFWKRA